MYVKFVKTSTNLSCFIYAVILYRVFLTLVGYYSAQLVYQKEWKVSVYTTCKNRFELG